ncbi:MAG: HAD-IA family hydrolase [Bacteroidota bacterium]
MTLRCQAIVFDLDGVLCDSTPIAERHWRRWAEARGVPVEPILAAHHGRPTVETIRQFAPHLDAEVEARAKERDEADDTDGLRAFDGAARLLTAIPQARWAIATSGRRRTATNRLRHTGLPIPPVLVTADDVQHGKPAPDPYRQAIDALGFAPADCLVFEDAPAGIASAQAAGAAAVGIASAGHPEWLVAAETVIERLADVQVIVESDGLVVTLQTR